MFLFGPTIAAASISVIGVIVAIPALARGFRRRGTGVNYEQNFLIQRAPQYASIITIAVIILSFLASNHVGKGFDRQFFLSAGDLLPQGVALTVSYLGLVVQISGFIFMIGGWYSLGEYFSTDAELLDSHQVKSNGLLKYVMHPSYSGIIQSLLGLSMVAVSPLSIGLVLFLVAPLWLNRASFEEKLLLEHLGPAYQQYASRMRWRRIMPFF